MQKHPDADSFVLEHLRQPANATTRLVFADWLEDTGTPSNVAWAHYIRLREEAERNAPDERWPLLRQADICAAKVRAKLTLAARVFVRNPESVLQLIPSANITVRLANFDTPRAVLEIVPESVARENDFLVLAVRGNTLFCANTPDDFDTAQKLMFILNKEIVLVGAERSDIREAINRGYGYAETESVDSVTYECPLVGLESDGHLFGIFHTAFSSAGVTGFTMKATEGGCTVRYYAGEAIASEELYPKRVYDHLLDHLLEQPRTAEYTRPGYLCLDLDVPLLSNRRFPVTLERPLVRDQCWFRLRFRW